MGQKSLGTVVSRVSNVLHGTAKLVKLHLIHLDELLILMGCATLPGHFSINQAVCRPFVPENGDV